MQRLCGKTLEDLVQRSPTPTNRIRVPQRLRQRCMPAGWDEQPAFAAPVVEFSARPSSHLRRASHHQRRAIHKTRTPKTGTPQKCLAMSLMGYLHPRLAPFRTDTHTVTRRTLGVPSASSASTIEKYSWTIQISNLKARIRLLRTSILCGFHAPLSQSSGF